MFHYHVSQEDPQSHLGASTSILSLGAQRLAHHVFIITAFFPPEPQTLHLLLPQCAIILHPSLPPPHYLLPH